MFSDLSRIEAVVMAMNDVEAKLIAARKLRERGFRGRIVSQALYEDQLARITAAGVDYAYLTFHQAGVGLAERAWNALEGERARGAAADDPPVRLTRPPAHSRGPGARRGAAYPPARSLCSATHGSS